MMLHFTAFYGVFDKNMNPKKVVEVSGRLQEFIQDNTITLPKETDFDALFPNKFKGAKFLQIQLDDGRRINIRNDNYPFGVTIDLLANDRQIGIVYFIFINPLSNWKDIISGQLSELRSYGLLDEADLYIHITDLHNTGGVLRFVNKITNRKAIITQSSTNEFEYPALRLLQTLAVQQPDKFFMYLHTKGMSRNIKKRLNEEQVLLAKTFGNWRMALQAFQDVSVNKIGLFPSIDTPGWGGWIWYNFFIARGSYLAGCEVVQPTIKRHDYESWLAKYRGGVAIYDCYSLFTGKKENFLPEQAIRNMDKLIAEFESLYRKRKISLRLRYPWIRIRK